MIPNKPGAEDVEAMSNRQKWLEELYFYDGRDKRDHEKLTVFSRVLLKKYQQFTD